MLRLLDRALFWRGLKALVLILGLTVLLVFGLDFILRYNALTSGTLSDDDSRVALILVYYCYRIPELAGPLLTLAMIGAGLVTCGPMLKRRELIALGAAGLSLRRITLPLIVLAALTGVVGVLVSDQLNPRLEGPRAVLKDRLQDSTRQARSWRSDGTAWFANHASLEESPPRLKQIIVAPADRRLLTAAALTWHDDHWRLQGVTRWDPDAKKEVAHLDEMACDGDLPLSLSPAELAQLLVSRYSMTSEQLVAEGDPVSRAFAYRRFTAGFTPLLALLLALTVFVRFDNADALLTAGIRALIAGAIPAGLMGIGNLALETSSMPPEIAAVLVIACAAAPSLWAYGRWRL